MKLIDHFDQLELLGKITESGHAAELEDASLERRGGGLLEVHPRTVSQATSGEYPPVGKV